MNVMKYDLHSSFFLVCFKGLLKCHIPKVNICVIDGLNIVFISLYFLIYLFLKDLHKEFDLNFNIFWIFFYIDLDDIIR